MKWSILIASAVLLWTNVGADAQNEQPKEIILDQIWAYDMPGIRKIEELAEGPDMRLLNGVLELAYHRADQLKFKDVARPGFAVSGSGRAALHAALAVFLDDRRREFSTDENITVVFFSEPLSRYRVQIRQVTRRNSEIEIQYELEPYIGGGMSYVNLALIPLGKLPLGKYNVAMTQLPREQKPVEIKAGFKPLDKEWSRNFLSKPFNFTVAEKRE